MIGHPAFAVEPWTLTEVAFSPEILEQTETLFTVSNGYLGLRGNLDEGEPVGQPGTYLNGFYERRPTAFEQGPPSARVPSNETTLNVTDGKLIRLRVDGDPLDVRSEGVRRHVRVLDMAAAELVRDVEWTAPSGATVEIRSRRLVSFALPELAAISYRILVLEGDAEIELTSSLVANESVQVREDDPRAAAPLYGQVLLPRVATARGSRLVAGYTTRASRLSVVTVADHVLDAEGAASDAFEESGTLGVIYRLRLAAGEAVTLTKFLSYAWSARGSIDALVEAGQGVVDRALALGYDALAERQRDYADAFWARTDVVVEGDPEVQQGVRFGLFQLLQATAHAKDLGVAAKGLTGQGYDGHRFWDSETFLVPILAHSTPAWARDLLAFRLRTLDQARARARSLELRGALFAWRTISGEDVSSYFPEGLAAYHLAADIAHAVEVYVGCSGDEEFLTQGGAALLVETARLWMALGHRDPERAGAFCIDEVTGPDEYSALVDNNLYTNVMAARNLAGAAEVVARLARTRPEAHRALVESTGLGPEEVEGWERAAADVYLPYDETRGIHAQDDAFLHHAPFDLASFGGKRPLLLFVHPLALYGRQVVKQADVLLALWLAGDRFSIEDKRRDFAYYEPITVHDSSLSAVAHAVVAAEIGDLDTAFAYLRRCALIDLDDLADDVRDGVHLAGAASGWSALIEGLAGYRPRGEVASFAPRLPAPLRRLAFPLAIRGARLEVEVTAERTRYRLVGEGTLRLEHHGTPVTLGPSHPEVGLPTLPAGPGP